MIRKKKTTAQRLWALLLARHRVKHPMSKQPIYGEPQITREQFYELIRDRDLGGDKFKCFYTGEILSGADASIDHKTPLSKGGQSEVLNLTICSERTNRIKGDLSGQGMRWLVWIFGLIDADDRASIENRLAAKPSWGGRDWKRGK